VDTTDLLRDNVDKCDDEREDGTTEKLAAGGESNTARNAVPVTRRGPLMNFII